MVLTRAQRRRLGGPLMSRMPTELVLEVAERLPLRDVARLARTCRTMERFLEQPLYRRAIFHKGGYQRTVLQRAVLANDVRLVFRILEQQPRDHDVRGPVSTAVGVAATMACKIGSYEMVEALVANYKAAVRQVGDVILHMTAMDGWPEIVGLLVRAGIPVDDKGSWDETPLNVAVRYNQLGSVEVLLSHGASRAEVTRKTRSKLRRMVVRGQREGKMKKMWF